jgi:uncharacterized protein (UPF0261 family)
MGKVYIAGTCDTKDAELLYAKRLVEKAGAKAVLVDVSTSQGWVSKKADVKPAEVAAFHPSTPYFLESIKDRGAAVAAMGEALAVFLLLKRDVGGVLGLGGGGNTSIVTAAMRALPIGVPKLMVSTMASGNVAPYVGPSDIAMMYAVTDIAGLNAISRQVIGNAAHAIAGMATKRVAKSKQDKPGVGLTMFGVTTACITQIRAALEKTHECFVFHATGTGGQSMEKLVDSGLLSAVIDITTTEVADYLCGGILACTEDRFGAIIRTRIPYVGSVGALDMVNFGAFETVPDRFGDRRLHIHNPQVTLMRTTPEENRNIGEWIVARLNRMEGPVRFLLPLRGVSAIDAPGQPFHDSAADEALFAAIREGWQDARNRKLIEVDAHINDTAFAATAVNAFRDVF